MDLCLAENWRTGPRVLMWWWEQEGLDLKGMMMAAWEAERTDGEEDTDGTEAATGD